MKPLIRFLAGIASVAAIHTSAQAQQVTLGFDDLGPCSGSISAYQSWIALVSPTSCQSGTFGLLTAHSPANYVRSTGTMEWSFLGGPVTFDGFFLSGVGQYFVQLLSGGNVVNSWSVFNGSGSNFLSSGYTGNVDGVRISGVSLLGAAQMGVDDIRFTALTVADPVDPVVDPVDVINQPNAAPEPATLLLVASGLGGLSAMARRRKQAGASA